MLGGCTDDVPKNYLALLSSLWPLQKVNYANSVWFLSIFWIAGLSNAT